MREHIEALINSDITAYRVSKETGIPQNTATRIFNGEASIDNISLKNAEILSNYYLKMEECKMKNVTTAFENELTYLLAESFSESVYGDEVTRIVENAFETAENGTDDFDLTVREFLVLTLEEDDKLLLKSAFESEEEAKKQQYYWKEELNRYLWLPY